MYCKIIILLILSYNILFAGYEKITIGKIDSYYKDKITKYELRQMIKEIEHMYESSTGVNAFDYTNNGKPINLVYVPPTSLEQRIENKVKRQENLRKELEYLKKELPKQKKKVIALKSKYEKKNKAHNQDVLRFNKRVKEINKRKNISKNELDRLKNEVRKEKNRLNKNANTLRKEQRVLSSKINAFNNKSNTYSRKINGYNEMGKEIESMSRSLKKIRARTFGLKEIKVSTVFKNGKATKEKKVTNKMSKIEIYGFFSKAELKAILAHEIGHLIGLPHISAKNALMNPILQKSQIRNLHLTFEDRQNFRENF